MKISPAASRPLVREMRGRKTIKIGELNSYKVFPAFLEPYKKGMELALEEIKRAGGVHGRKLELVSRDDGGNPGDAVRVAEELIARERVARADGHLRLQRRPGGREPRRAAQDPVRRLRAAHRQDRLGERQPLHLPAAAFDLHADRDADPGGGEAEEAALGDRLSELRVRAVGHRLIQEAACAGPARRGVRRRAGARRWARSTPARSCRRSPRQSPTRSSARCSPPTCRSSCARATRAACSRTPWCSTCSPASPSTSIRSRTKRPTAGGSPAIRGARSIHAGAQAIPRRVPEALEGLPAPGLGRRLHRGVLGGERDAQGRSPRTPRSWSRRLKGLEMQTPFGPIVWRAHRPPVDDGRLRRPASQKGRQGHDGQLALRRRRQGPACRCRKSAH